VLHTFVSTTKKRKHILLSIWAICFYDILCVACTAQAAQINSSPTRHHQEFFFIWIPLR
jgi:hypothetical protein